MSSKSANYLIALDLDGTLLNDEKTISPLNKKVLTCLEEQGNKVVLCSGRALRSVTYYYNILNFKHSPVITYNGHLVKDLKDKNFPEISHSLNKNTVKSIYKELHDNKLITSAMSESLTTIYCDDVEDNFLFAFYDTKNMEVKSGLLSETINEDVFTCVFKYETGLGHEDKIKQVVEKFPDVEVRFWFGGNYCELYIGDISKARAIKHVAKYYNIPEENIFAFGDSDNDKEMLKELKNSYLMKNGNPTLIPDAKHITSYTNNDDGVGVELIKIFNLKI